ncbi:MAG: hypothetical protein PHU46_13325 [Rhodocyclaceae bacterium]|nr:hypothetical protein [Rhodocyclaceae bacterium]
MAVVFAKTQKGQTEVETRSGGLSPRVRRVLIMVDGRRTVDELRGMLAADDLTHTLGMLEEEGYIAMTALKDERSGQTRAAPDHPLPAITAFRPLVIQSGDPSKLDKARNFMANTLNVFVGSLGASSLLTRIETAEGHEGLRAVFDEWYQAMVSSRDGRREAESLRTKLLEVI